jgi:hypothetical protein
MSKVVHLQLRPNPLASYTEKDAVTNLADVPDNHLTATVSMDFFTVSALTGRVPFVLVLLSHERRRVVHFNATEHPSASWTAQQVVDAFPDDTAPRWLLRDRDSIYGEAFRRRVTGMGIAEGERTRPGRG